MVVVVVAAGLLRVAAVQLRLLKSREGQTEAHRQKHLEVPHVLLGFPGTLCQQLAGLPSRRRPGNDPRNGAREPQTDLPKNDASTKMG